MKSPLHNCTYIDKNSSANTDMTIHLHFYKGNMQLHHEVLDNKYYHQDNFHHLEVGMEHRQVTETPGTKICNI